MKIVSRVLVVAAVIAGTAVVARASETESSGGRTRPGGAPSAKYPEVVIYTAPWCSSCKAAGEFMTRNNIPFVKKDVDANPGYLEEMSSKYRASAVPVIVIGRDQKVIKGFVQEAFQRAYRDVLSARNAATSALK